MTMTYQGERCTRKLKLLFLIFHKVMHSSAYDLLSCLDMLVWLTTLKDICLQPGVHLTLHDRRWPFRITGFKRASFALLVLSLLSLDQNNLCGMVHVLKTPMDLKPSNLFHLSIVQGRYFIVFITGCNISVRLLDFYGEILKISMIVMSQWPLCSVVWCLLDLFF